MNVKQNKINVATTTQQQPFYGFFSRTTWINRYQKGFWILMKQEMMGWQRHKLDHMQIMCTLLQTDNHASTSSLTFYGSHALPTSSYFPVPELTNLKCQTTEGQINAK